MESEQKTASPASDGTGSAPPRRVGKIAQFPSAIREEINQRLFDGQQGPQILPWLNTQPDVIRLLNERFDGVLVSDNNLSEWRRGGYQDWLQRRERVGHLKTLSEYAFNLAKAGGGSISEGSAAIAGGKILELLENASNDDLEKLIDSLVLLRRAEIATLRVRQRDVVLGQRDRTLAIQEKAFQIKTVEYLMKFYNDQRARDIIEGKGSKEVRMENLVQLVFGQPSK